MVVVAIVVTWEARILLLANIPLLVYWIFAVYIVYI